MSSLSNKYYNVRIKLRNDSHSNWQIEEKTFIPCDGEIIIYDPLNEAEAKRLNKQPIPISLIKIGDGITNLYNLPFINDYYGIIKTGKEKGSISILGNDVFVKGLELSEQNNIMAFQPIENYYNKEEIEEKYYTKEEVSKEINRIVINEGGSILGTQGSIYYTKENVNEEGDKINDFLIFNGNCNS